jgi:hypothetical protein
MGGGSGSRSVATGGTSEVTIEPAAVPLIIAELWRLFPR